MAVGTTTTRQNGTFIYPVYDSVGRRILTRNVPYVGEWTDATLHSADLRAPSSHAFGRVPVKEFQWAAELTNCSFSLSVAQDMAMTR